MQYIHVNRISILKFSVYITQLSLAYCIITSRHILRIAPKYRVPTALNHDWLKNYGLVALTMNNLSVSHCSAVSKREKNCRI